MGKRTKAEKQALKAIRNRAKRDKVSFPVALRRETALAEREELAGQMRMELMRSVEFAAIAAYYPAQDEHGQADNADLGRLLATPHHAARLDNDILFTIPRLREAMREVDADQRLQELSDYKLKQLLAGIGVGGRTLFGEGTGMAKVQAFYVTEPEDTGCIVAGGPEALAWLMGIEDTPGQAGSSRWGNA